MNAFDPRNAVIENAPPTVWATDLVALKAAGPNIGLSCAMRAVVAMFEFVRMPERSNHGAAAEVEMRSWTWHGFTFPSKPVAGSAA
jgi:hypothetical protein